MRTITGGIILGIEASDPARKWETDTPQGRLVSGEQGYRGEGAKAWLWEFKFLPFLPPAFRHLGLGDLLFQLGQRLCLQGLAVQEVL